MTLIKGPRDWVDIVEWDRVAVPALDLRFGYDNFVQLLYLPWFTPSKLPISNSRWDRDLTLGLKFGEQQVLSRNNFQFAFRAGLVLKGFDIGLSFYEGHSYSPSFRLESISTTEFRLVPVYREEEVFSNYISKEILGFIFRSEIGFFSQEDEDNFVQFVLGVDREWSRFLKATDSFYILIQYVNEIETQTNSPVQFDTIDFRRSFNNSLMGRLKYSFDQESRLALKFEGSFNFSDQDYYFEPAVVLQKNNFQIEAGVGLLSGRQQTFWGGYEKNDRVFAKITYVY